MIQDKMFEDARNLFPHIKSGKIYFNHASIGPLSSRVASVIKDYAEERSSGKIKNYDDFLEVDKSAKLQLAKVLGCEPENLAWTDNVSNAMNFLAQGIDLQNGDEILLTNQEFPANVYPFLNLQNKGVQVKFVEAINGQLPHELILKNVTEKTKLISISFVQFVTGWRTDIKKLGEFCRENNIIFSVDGIQGAGALYPDLRNSGVDFFAGGTQKWFMALQGLSYFYVSDELLNRIRQKSLGWLSVKSAWELLNYDMELKPDATRYQTGTQNALGIFAFDESLKLFNQYGIGQINDKVLSNSIYFISKLEEAGIAPLLKGVEKKNLSGIVTVPFTKPMENLEKLKEKNIHAEVREGYFRFSPHFYNTQDEIDIVVKALAELT